MITTAARMTPLRSIRWLAAGKCIRGLCCMGCNRRVLGNIDAVGADKVFDYLTGAQAVVHALLASA